MELKLSVNAAASAECHLHKGAESRKDIMDKLSIPGGSHTSHSFKLKDNKRLRKAHTQATTKEKKRRQAVQLVHTRWEEALRDLEGITYEAEGFWLATLSLWKLILDSFPTIDVFVQDSS